MEALKISIRKSSWTTAPSMWLKGQLTSAQARRPRSVCPTPTECDWAKRRRTGALPRTLVNRRANEYTTLAEYMNAFAHLGRCWCRWQWGCVSGCWWWRPRRKGSYPTEPWALWPGRPQPPSWEEAGTASARPAWTEAETYGRQRIRRIVVRKLVWVTKGISSIFVWDNPGSTGKGMMIGLCTSVWRSKKNNHQKTKTNFR